jgi:hypothetical protein
VVSAASSATAARPGAASIVDRAASGACPARTATGVARRAATTLVNRARIARARSTGITARARSSAGITARTVAHGDLDGCGFRSCRRSGWRVRVRRRGCIASARLLAMFGAVLSAGRRRSLVDLSRQLGAWRIAGPNREGWRSDPSNREGRRGDLTDPERERRIGRFGTQRFDKDQQGRDQDPEGDDTRDRNERAASRSRYPPSRNPGTSIDDPAALEHPSSISARGGAKGRASPEDPGARSPDRPLQPSALRTGFELPISPEGLRSLAGREELTGGVRILGVVDEVQAGPVDQAVSTSHLDDLGIDDPGPECVHVRTFSPPSLAETPNPNARSVSSPSHRGPLVRQDLVIGSSSRAPREPGAGRTSERCMSELTDTGGVKPPGARRG